MVRLRGLVFVRAGVAQRRGGSSIMHQRSTFNPSENGLWPSLVFPGRSWKIYGDICKADVASILK